VGVASAENVSAQLVAEMAILRFSVALCDLA
jgi:hypothetical protein